MKNLLKHRYSLTTTFSLLMVVAMSVAGCSKRDYVVAQTLPLEIQLDWGTTAQEQIPSSLLLLLYDKDDNLTEYTINSNGTTLNLEEGSYKAICVNQTDGVSVINKDSYATAQVIAQEITSKAIDQPIIYTCGWVFAYSTTDIEVGGITTYVTKNGSTTGATSNTVKFQMQKIVQKVNFSFSLDGLNPADIERAVGRLGNVASTVGLSDCEIICGNAGACEFELEVDENGNLTGWILIFGNEVIEDPNLLNMLEVDIYLLSGDVMGTEKDITDQMKDSKEDVNGELYVNIDGEVKAQVIAGIKTIVINWLDGGNNNLDGK